MDFIITTPETLRTIFLEAIDERDERLKKLLGALPRDKEKMGVSEVVDYLGERGFLTTVGSIYNMTKSKRIPHQTVNRKLIFDCGEVDRWLERQIKK